MLTLGRSPVAAPVPPADVTTAATIGPVTLTRDQLETYWKLLPQDRRAAYESQGGLKAFRDDFVKQQLMILEAERTGLAQDPALLTQLELMRGSLLSQALIEREVQAKIVPEADIKTYYEAHAVDFTEPEMVHARHILVTPRKDLRVPNSTGDDAGDETSAKAKMARIEKDLAAGKDFAQLARELSEDVSAPQGGELGFFPRGRMVKPFDDAAFALEAGQRSGVVESTYGYHIIEVLERRKARVPALDEVRERIKMVLARERKDSYQPRFESFIAGLKERYKVTLNDAALGGAAKPAAPGSP